MTVDWLDPQPIGVDAFGTTHYLNTVGTHTAFIGITGSGKTKTARGFVALGVLDPKPRLAIFDGKDDNSDWRPMADLCDLGYVAGSSSASIGAVERLLLKLEQVNNSRAEGDHGASEPIIVVVDEWYRTRQAAKRHDPDAAKRIDGLMADLAATSRSRHIHIVYCFQRGTTAFMPGDLGANIGQRVQGRAATPAEIRYAIHSNPDVVPSRVGEFLVSTDDGGTSELVVVPYLDDDAFRVVCDRARRLRRPAVDLRKPERAPEEPATWQELVEVILAEAQEALTTSSIHAALGEAAPTAHANRFGRLLAEDSKSDLPTVMAARTRRATRGWTLADSVLPAQGEYIGPDPRSETLTDRLLALGGVA